MNERIRELVRESNLDVYGLGKERYRWEYTVEKFTKLIVKDCLDFLEADAAKAPDNSEVQAALLSCALDILEHFDIELDDEEQE